MNSTVVSTKPEPALYGPDIATSPAIARYLIQGQSPLSIGLVVFIGAILSFLLQQFLKPAVHPQSPKFTSNTLPWIGSLGLMTNHWTFWKACVKESKTGQFSFWLGRKHVVGLSGPAARKVFFEHPALDHHKATDITPFGVNFPPMHPIFVPRDEKFQKSTYWLRTLTYLMKTPNMERCLSSVIQDARRGLEALIRDNPSGIINTPKVWPIVFKQTVRVLLADDVADNPELWATTLGAIDTILHSFSPFHTMLPWVPEPSMIRRRIARRTLLRVSRGILRDRHASPKSASKNDAVQSLINIGDPDDHISEFMINAAFVGVVNAHVLFPQLLNALAVHVDWQDKVYKEITEVADQHCKDECLPLADKLFHIPLSAWENALPNTALMMEEISRIWTSFPAPRFNILQEPIPIPGTNEVIPARTHVIYNTTEIHFNPNLYERPASFRPERFAPGSQKTWDKEPHGWNVWGTGQRLCSGMRWAKLQQFILMAVAVSLYKLEKCDKDGKPDSSAYEKQQAMDADLDEEVAFVLPACYVKLVPRK